MKKNGEESVDLGVDGLNFFCIINNLFFEKLSLIKRGRGNGPDDASATRSGRVPIPARKGRDECSLKNFPIIRESFLF